MSHPIWDITGSSEPPPLCPYVSLWPLMSYVPSHVGHRTGSSESPPLWGNPTYPWVPPLPTLCVPLALMSYVPSWDIRTALQSPPLFDSPAAPGPPHPPNLCPPQGHRIGHTPTRYPITHKYWILGIRYYIMRIWYIMRYDNKTKIYYITKI